MSDLRVGAALRAVRIRRRWRQFDLAERSHVSAATISNLERGRFDRTSLETLRTVANALEIRIDVVARWRGGDLDRLINARHSYLATAVIELLRRHGWQVVPEVSFSIYGERGVIDLLAWHGPSRTLLVIELKTEVVDAAEMLGVLDRKTRLAKGIARDRGWNALEVSTWLVIADSSTNRSRVKVLEPLLRSALPTSGREMKAWLQLPTGPIAGLSFFQNFSGTSAVQELSSRQRVRVPKSSVSVSRRASARGRRDG